MTKMDRYPELRRAVPMNFLRPSRTSRILTPGIILATVAILAATSITGIVIVVSIFDSVSPHKLGESVAQVFVLIAAGISIVYIVLHFIATFKNEPIGIVRPPEIRVHGYCFATARLALVAWMIALIASSVVVSKPSVCLRWNRDCKLQVLDIVGSSLAFFSMGIVLSALESAHDPFQIPAFLHIPRAITCRVSSFGSEIFDRSTRASWHDDENVFEEIQHLSAMEQATIAKKPLPPKPTKPRKSSVPGEFPEECPVTLPPMAQKRARGWSEEWTHLVQGTSTNDMARTTSSGSISESSSYTSTSDRSSNTSVSKRVPCPRNVTPSSSISNLSRRSPLSTMRSIEFPDVPIPAQLRYLPPVIASPHEWSHSKTASLAQLLPVADVHNPRRRSSGARTALSIMKPIPLSPLEFAPTFKRTTLDVKIPGAFIDYHPSLEDQMKLEEHARMIEQETARIQAAQKREGPVRVLAEQFKKQYGINALDSRSRYRQHKRDPPASMTVQSADTCADSAVFMEAVKVEFVKSSKSGRQVKGSKVKTKHFRRLTLGDISPELGKLWDD